MNDDRTKKYVNPWKNQILQFDKAKKPEKQTEKDTNSEIKSKPQPELSNPILKKVLKTRFAHDPEKIEDKSSRESMLKEIENFRFKEKIQCRRLML